MCVFVSEANLLKTAVSVLASTVRLTVSFMEPLMSVSVMLRCSQLDVSSSALERAQPSALGEEGGATEAPNQQSHSGGLQRGDMTSDQREPRLDNQQFI